MASLPPCLASNLLLLLTFLGVLLGAGLGLGLRPLLLQQGDILLLSYPGEIFMRLLKLMILPLVIASLITGAASLNARLNGKMALRVVVFFLTTSLLSSMVGLAFTVVIHPGSPTVKEVLGQGTTGERRVELVDNFLDLGRNLVPDNIFRASLQSAITKYKEGESTLLNDTHSNTLVVKTLEYRSGTNTLGIIFFCLAFGTVLGSLGPTGRPLVNLFSVIDRVIMKMVLLIMWLSPLGIASVIAAKILAVEDLVVVMSQLGLFIMTVCSAIFFYQLLVYPSIYLIMVRKNPLRFVYGLLQAWMTAFATASTAAALPVSLRCMTENNQVDSRVSKFVLPIGATVNMDGTALFITSASVFIAQMNSIDLSLGDYATVVLTSTAASIAAASVPSAALVLMLLVLTAIDAPYTDVSLLWAIDWFVDRCRTTNNMLGDCYAAAVVEALSRKELEAMDRRAGKEQARGQGQGPGEGAGAAPRNLSA